MGSRAQERSAPPAVGVDLTGSELHSYWLDRVAQHTRDSYAGVTLCKFPEDLRTYEHLLWDSAPDTVIELGTYCGASALWFRDRLRTLRDYGRIAREPRVISIDLDQSLARTALSEADAGFAEQIELVAGDVTDPALPSRIGGLLRPGASCMVIEDSAHEFETTWGALTGFAGFVAAGGYFVVEDGCVDVEELRPPGEDWPRGVLPALERWLSTPEGSEFELRRDLEVYGLTCHPRGFLQRRP
jgi:cephalosporin hydroxylase